MYRNNTQPSHKPGAFRFVLTLTVGTLCVALASPLAAAKSADTFQAKCAMCHGADARGNTPIGKKFNIPDLRAAGVQKQSDDELVGVITKGKPPMPAFGGELSTGEIHDLVSYIRDLATK